MTRSPDGWAPDRGWWPALAWELNGGPEPLGASKSLDPQKSYLGSRSLKSWVLPVPQKYVSFLAKKASTTTLKANILHTVGLQVLFLSSLNAIKPVLSDPVIPTLGPNVKITLNVDIHTNIHIDVNFNAIFFEEIHENTKTVNIKIYVYMCMYIYISMQVPGIRSVLFECPALRRSRLQGLCVAMQRPCPKGPSTQIAFIYR